MPHYKAPKGVPLRRIERRPLVVITLDKNKRPLGWCTAERAGGLIRNGRAVVYRYYPFTIILKDKDVREQEVHHNYRIKIDPGSKVTGVSVVEFAPDGNATVVLFAQIEHRAETVVKNIQTRNASRRNRRSRETWYRHCKFPSGTSPSARPEGWLPPSQRSIADNVISFVNKLIRFLGPCDVTVESVKFDTQLMENPDSHEKEYQHGTLYGYELKSYLIEKYAHTCQYCGGVSEDRRLEWEHKIPKSRGGSDSVKNATLACSTCNSAKGNRTPEEWLSALQAKPKLSKLEETQCAGIQNVIAGKPTNRSLRYAAWANTTRKYLVNGLRLIPGVQEVEFTSGGRTAYNRSVLGYEKDHHIDALVCGKHNPGSRYKHDDQPVLYVTATGRGSRLRGHLNKCGIIIAKYSSRNKCVNGLQTGDIVHVTIPSGKYKGSYIGRIMVRTSGYHDIRCTDGKLVTGTKKSIYKFIQHQDGYQYGWRT